MAAVSRYAESDELCRHLSLLRVQNGQRREKKKETGNTRRKKKESMMVEDVVH